MPIATNLGRIASALEAQNADDVAERDQRDLNAQEDMATWAQAVFWAAAVQAFFSLVGIILIYITFRETRRAADAGDKMAEEAKASTAAALRSATVAEQALVGVERPFLAIQLGRSGPTAQSYGFVNYGRSACVILHAEVHYIPITPLDVAKPLKPNFLQTALTPDWNVVGPNGGEGGESFVRLGQPVVEGADKANIRMLHGYVIYRSLTGDTFVGGFGLYKKTGESWKALTEAAFNYDERVEKGRLPKKGSFTIRVSTDRGGEA